MATTQNVYANVKARESLAAERHGVSPIRCRTDFV